MVVVIHASSGSTWDVAQGSLRWHILNLWNASARGSVALFLMISGVNFLHRAEPVRLRTLFTKYVLRMAVLYAVWRLLYAVDTQGLQALLSPAGWLRILRTNAKYHLWFLPRMLAAYLMLPALWVLVHAREGKYAHYLSVLSLVLFFASSTLQAVNVSQNLTNLLARTTLPLGVFPCYMLLGYSLSVLPVRVRSVWLFLLWAAVTVVMGLGSAVLCLRFGREQDVLFGMTGLLPCLQSCLLFLLFRNFCGSALLRRLQKPLSVLSGATLGVYLLHVFVLEHLRLWFGVHGASLQPLWMVPLLSTAVFLLCVPVALLLRKIPAVGKWLA